MLQINVVSAVCDFIANTDILNRFYRKGVPFSVLCFIFFTIFSFCVCVGVRTCALLCGLLERSYPIQSRNISGDIRTEVDGDGIPTPTFPSPQFRKKKTP